MRIIKLFLVLFAFIFSLASTANPLAAKEVFQAKVSLKDPNTFIVHWDIKPGYFLYADRIKVQKDAKAALDLASFIFPKTETKTDKEGKTYAIYRNDLNLPVSILGEKAGEAFMTLHYQGCSDSGFCYPPETKAIQVQFDNTLGLKSLRLIDEIPIKTTKDEPNSLLTTLEDQSWFMTLLLFFGFGLLLSFTPCILPMVPVLSSIIVGQSKNLSTKKAFFLSLSYVLSMSITYAIIGAGVALAGANLQITMQSPWAIGLLSFFFVALALSMFGFYELQLPQSFQTKISSLSRNQNKGHYLSAAIMGCLSTLILSPCVTAPLIAVLGYIASTGEIGFGMIALFVLGLGMGTPLLLIGTSAGKWLPKAGAWMVAIKTFFGLLLVAVAIYLISRIVPTWLTMLLWAALLIFAGIACNAFKTTKSRLRQGAGLALGLYGLFLIIGAVLGEDDPLRPLASLQNQHYKEVPQLAHATVRSEKCLETALNEAKGKLVILDFYADWCSTCKSLEKSLFKNAEVQQALQKFTVIKVDVTENTPATQALLKRFKVVAPPTFLFYNDKGEELKHLTLVGDVSKEKMLGHLNDVRDPRSPH